MLWTNRLTVDVYTSGDEEHTHAEVVLHTRDSVVRATGEARRRPGDAEAPEVGEELAVGRAFASLGAQLIGDGLVDAADKRATV